MLKTCLFDDRNPERWTKADRARKTKRAVVSTRWSTNPFGIADVEVMPAVQPGVLYWDGRPANADGYNGRLAERLAALPDSLLVDGSRFLIWESADKRQALYGFDLSRLDVVEAWTSEILASFPWAHGVHLDYFTDLAWLVPDGYDATYWSAYNLGYALAASTLDLAGLVLVGQQFHETRLTKYADAQFFEESPGHFGRTFEENAATVAALRVPAWACFELRFPWIWTDAYRRQVIRFALDHGVYLSWDRGANALVGLAELASEVEGA